MRVYFTYLAVVSALTAVLVFTRDFRSVKAWWIGAWLGVVSFVPWLFNSTRCEWFGDFMSAYYPAGIAAVNDSRLMYLDLGLDGFMNVPLIALLFSPLALLAPGPSAAVFSAIGVIAIAITAIYCVRRAVSWRRGLLILCLFSLNGPLYASVKEGNLTHLMLPLLLAAIVAFERERYFGCGLLLGVLALIKPPLLIIAGCFLVRGAWRGLLGAAASISAVALLSVSLFGWPLHLTWYEQCIVPFQGHALVAFNCQSVTCFVVRSLTHLNPGEWQLHQLSAGLRLWTVIPIVLLCAVSLMQMPGRTAGTGPRWSGIAVCLSLAISISPASWTHYYCLLLVPVSLIIGECCLDRAELRSVLVLAFAILLLSLPMTYVPPKPDLLPEWITKAFVSHYLYGNVLLTAWMLFAAPKVCLRTWASEGAPMDGLLGWRTGRLIGSGVRR